MHESDAMEFIETVLLGFLGRHFDYQESEDPRRVDLHLNKIRAFIQDRESYWVKEKSLEIINQIGIAEYSINMGKYTPTTAETLLDLILNKAKTRIIDKANYCRDEDNKDSTHVFVRFPLFPEK